MRRLITLLSVVIAVPLAWYSWLLWQNNRPSEPPGSAELSMKLDLAADWLETNRDMVEQDENPILWWMLKQSSEISGNPRLVSFYQGFKTRKLDISPNNIWSPAFDSSIQIKLPPVEHLYILPQYNLLFLYGLTCDRQLAREPEIRRQLDKEFCNAHILHPRCITHQLMGVRFMQRNNCGDSYENAELAKALQNSIVMELTWDPRVVDAYIQRILMLVESGAANRVKPVWIQHFLKAQNMDGGWDDLDPIFNLPDGQSFGFTSKGPTLGTQHSNFHATAQGIWLISLLLEQASRH